jgi:prophage tail gpP-like protein
VLDEELSIKDVVTLELGGDRLAVDNGYEVRATVFEVPNNAFSVPVQVNESVRGMLRRYPPRTPFRLFIGGRLQFLGYTDGEPDVDRPHGGPTTLTFSGRDFGAELLHNYVDADKDYSDRTTLELVRIALTACKLDADILEDMASSRKTKAGVPVTALKNPPAAPTARNKKRHASIGETWWQFLHRDLEHAGQFLFASPLVDQTGRPTFVITVPNASQKPIYRLRIPSGSVGRPGSAVLSASRRNRTEHRFAQYAVYGRGGGKRFGNAKASGRFDDSEMGGWGYARLRTFKDINVSSDDEASFFAARRLAETQRNGFQLAYVVAGHLTRSISGSRAIWTPDTCVDLEDEDTGDRGTFWISQCVYRGNPATTELHLLKPEHLTFGSDA